MRNLVQTITNPLVNAVILSMSWGCKADTLHDQGMFYGFEDIDPSARLTWASCFDDYKCSRLEVPLDYSNRSLGTTSIAFIELPGKNATVASPSLVIIPGGPGGSGVDLLLTYRDLLEQDFGEQYNFVSFDPRGVNNSGLRLDCFSGTRRKFLFKLYLRRVVQRAVENESPYGYYVTTPAVAHDLLTFIEAEAEGAGKSPSDAKLWAYGASYGIVIGSTFASMLSGRVGRMILDGVLNAEQYYNNEWKENVDQMDEAIEKFSSFCHSAGPGNGRNNRRLQNHPVPLSMVRGQELPTMVTCFDLKALFINAINSPLANFPGMAHVLHQLERGNMSALAGTFDGLGYFSDSRLAIQCADSYGSNRLTTFEEFKDYVKHTTSKSRYIGDIYPLALDSILCRSLRPQLPDSMMVQGRKALFLSLSLSRMSKLHLG
ncbi:hypothetical protein BDV09DRAFT_190808 [Aspergillus tetrazonus]